MKYLECQIIRNSQIAYQIYELILDWAEEGDPLDWAGKFVSIYCGDPSKLLPRPISVCDYNGKHLRLVYRIAGGGTELISRLSAGSQVRVIGPLGNGFEDFANAAFAEKGPNFAIVGGGIGSPPMLFSARLLTEKYGLKPAVFLGFRDKSQVILEDDFSKYTNNLQIATDAGDYGEQGTILDLLNAYKAPIDGIFACGPRGMLAELSKWCQARNIDCYVSMEERMACSVGACLGCVLKIRSTSGVAGFEHKKVCDCGPVFDAKEVVW